MILTEDDLRTGKDIVEKCLNLKENEIRNYIQDSLNNFIEKLELDTSKLDDRNKIYEFLKHQSALFINFQINPELYLLGEKEERKALIGSGIINDICKEYRKQGL